MGRFGVREHQLMFTVLMLEKIIDTVLLHQPADEIEVGLTILNAVVELRTFLAQLQLEVVKAAVLKNLLYYFRSFYVLEDSTIGRAPEQPKPRPEHDMIGVMVVQNSGPFRLDEDAAELPLLLVHLELDSTLLANCFIEVDIGLLAEAFHAKLE